MLLDMTLNIEITAHRSSDLFRKIFRLPRKRSIDVIFRINLTRDQVEIKSVKSEKDCSRAHACVCALDL
jgi:hypothetical protein